MTVGWTGDVQENIVTARQADRRRFLEVVGAALAGSLLTTTTGAVLARQGGPIKALAIDGLTTFDTRPVVALADQIFPGRGGELCQVWRTRQFEYTWLRTLMGRYADFRQVTDEALVFATQQLKLELRDESRAQLMDSFLSLEAWPDVLPAFTRLREAGIRLAFLANFTDQMLRSGMRNSGLTDLMEPPLSTDRVRLYKPHPRAYQMGPEAFGLPLEQMGFAAFGGWDVAGAKAFGYSTFWVNRTQQPNEGLGLTADAEGKTCEALVPWALDR